MHEGGSPGLISLTLTKRAGIKKRPLYFIFTGSKHTPFMNGWGMKTGHRCFLENSCDCSKNEPYE